MDPVGKREELEERRQRVSEAAWRILVRYGLGELSVRNVAAEAGLAPSSLRYIFPTQASVREQAVSLVRDRLTARLDAVPTEPGGRARGRAMVLELMPLDADRRMEMEVYLALGTAAMTDSQLQPTHHETHQLIRTVCALAVNTILPEGHPPDTRETETERLHALIDGMALHLVRQQPDDDTTWAIAVLDHHLAQLPHHPTAPQFDPVG